MSQHFLFPCPNCQAAFELTSKQAGQGLTCRECGQACDAPKLGQLRRLPPVDPAAETGADGRQATAGSVNAKSVKAANPLKNLLFAAGLVMLVVGASAGYGLYRYGSSKIQPFDLEANIAENEKFVDAQPPLRVMNLYELLKIDEGLGEWKEQEIVGQNRQGEILQQISYGLFGLGGLGLITLLGSLALKGRR